MSVTLQVLVKPLISPWLCVLQVSTHHMHSSSEDDDMEGPFPNDLSLQQVKKNKPQLQNFFSQRSIKKKPTAILSLQAFSDYQIQQMTANFVEQFGFHDEEFSEHDENIKYVVIQVSHH